MKLTATVIEVAPHGVHTVVRFQLAGSDGTATTGDCFNVVTGDRAGYEVGQVFTFTL
jgi:hypothetical protein